MPYEISFTKQLTVVDAELYMNECCWGGDVVTEKFLPSIRDRYEVADSGQEDWGWYIWFRKGPTALAFDVFCDDPTKGEFRILLTSRQKRLLFLSRISDTPELEELKGLVVPVLEAWVAPHSCQVTKVGAV